MLRKVQVIKIPTQFINYITRADGSASLRFGTSMEITEEDIVEFHRHRGLEGWLIFAENDLQEVEIPEMDAEFESKTHAQRLRNVLYVQLEQKLARKPTDNEFSDYYKAKMEAIINKIKQTLE